MADEMQKKGSGSKWSRAWMFVAPVGLWRVGRDTAQSVRDTFRRSSATVREIGHERQPTRSDWNATIAGLGVTQDRIEREVSRRQFMAYISTIFFLVGLYGIFAWSALLPGVGCAALSALYYLQSVLRLHQIRNHEFISITGFIARAKRQPRELLPLGLPAGWKLFTGKSK